MLHARYTPIGGNLTLFSTYSSNFRADGEELEPKPGGSEVARPPHAIFDACLALVRLPAEKCVFGHMVTLCQTRFLTTVRLITHLNRLRLPPNFMGSLPAPSPPTPHAWIVLRCLPGDGDVSTVAKNRPLPAHMTEFTPPAP